MLPSESELHWARCCMTIPRQLCGSLKRGAVTYGHLPGESRNNNFNEIKLAQLKFSKAH